MQHKHAYRLRITFIYITLTFINMATVRKFEDMFGKLNKVWIYTSGSYVYKWITKLYNY
jgi:hypothetical protein